MYPMKNNLAFLSLTSGTGALSKIFDFLRKSEHSDLIKTENFLRITFLMDLLIKSYTYFKRNILKDLFLRKICQEHLD